MERAGPAGRVESSGTRRQGEGGMCQAILLCIYVYNIQCVRVPVSKCSLA